MNEPFLIPVNYKGQELSFEAVLQVTAYTHRFHVQVGSLTILFERDEEGQYRAIVPQEKEAQKIDAGLLESIAKAIEDILA